MEQTLFHWGILGDCVEPATLSGASSSSLSLSPQAPSQDH